MSIIACGDNLQAGGSCEEDAMIVVVVCEKLRRRLVLLNLKQIVRVIAWLSLMCKFFFSLSRFGGVVEGQIIGGVIW